MRRLPRTSAVLAVLAALPLAVLPTAVADAAPAAPPATYLALGDSVAAGVGASRPGLGYVPLVADALRSARRCGADQASSCLREAVDLSVSGATTATLIASQLPAATALLQQRNGNATREDDVRLVTLTVGGNDLFSPVIAACQDPNAPVCSSTVAAQLQQVATGYAVVLGQLRAAAGRDTTIAVTTYYNGLAAPGCRAAALSVLAQAVLEGGPGVPAGLNDVIRQAAQVHGAVVVETAPVVEPAEVRPDCLHPTDQGHADIAGAVTAAVLPAVVDGPVAPPPAPVQPAITVERGVIDVGQTHVLRVVGPAGASVQLFGAGAPFATPKLIRQEVLKADGPGGSMAWELQPGATTRFSAVVGGVRTGTVQVGVRRTVTIGVRRADRAHTFSGAVARPVPGVQVTIARLDPATRRVVGIASTRTTAGGRYEVRTGLPAGFAGYYALTSATPDLLPGRSRLYGLVVPRP